MKKGTWIKVNTDHDSDPDYQVLVNAIKEIPSSVDGMSCEIGLRKGGATGHVINALKDRSGTKVHVAVDPFGDIGCG